MTLIQFDRRATHRIFSEPVALDMVNDTDALAQEALTYLEAAHWLALGTGDRALVRGIAVAHARLTEIRRIAHHCAALIEESTKVDPYLAVQFGSPRAA
jgi:hypothetical protein